MHVVVCTKLVPSPDADAALDQVSKRLDRSGQAVLDDADTYGVEVGLRLVEQVGQGEVTVVSMAPAADSAPLRSALAMGASRAVVISDGALVGTDALGTAKVLAAAIRQLAPDLVLAATESTDGYTGTVPIQLAELLGAPSVSFARHIEVHDGALLVDRQTEQGYDEISSPLPAVVTVTAGVVEVRYPSIRGIMAAKSKPIDILTLADLAIDPASVGASGAREEVIDITPAAGRGGGRIVVDEGSAEIEILALLDTLKAL